MNKFTFLSTVWPFDQFTIIACRVVKMSPSLIKSNEDLQFLIDRIVTGSPAGFANLMISLRGL